jgi:hypothetical protein
MEVPARYKEWAPRMVGELIEDFDLKDFQAAGIVGNAGGESKGFTQMQELKPTVAGSRGGLGGFQWTGPRRVAFEAWLKRKGWTAHDYEANYSFLFRELTSTERATIPAVAAATTIEEATKAFMVKFERPGVPHYEGRVSWAQEALKLYRAKKAAEPAVVEPEPAPLPEPEPAPAAALPSESIQAMIQMILPHLIPIIIQQVTAAINRPEVPLRSELPQTAAMEVAEAVAAQVRQLPEVRHVTNTEVHWYQQRSKWAAILAIATPIAALIGWNIQPEQQELIIGGIVTVGNMVAAYLAYRAGTASKPLGA